MEFGAVQEVRQLTLEIQGLRTQLGLPGVQEAPTACPTLLEFAPRFLDEYSRANRQKPRGIESKEDHLRIHLLPRFGNQKLSLICDRDIQQLKAELADLSPKTVNNILSTLSKLLKVAIDWSVLEKMPVKIRPLPTARPQMRFFEFGDFARLVEAAKVDPRSMVVVLLGGHAGLRLGEMIGLEWPDIDWQREQILIQRSESKGIVTLPKGGHARYVPMTRMLLAALRVLGAKRREGTKRVLLRNNGKQVREQTVRTLVGYAQKGGRVLDVSNLGALHILRHTFCSHLAMRGAPVIAIQNLAGHTDLRTTMRYMHLAPTEAKNAVALLDEGHPPSQHGKRDAHDKA